MNSSITLIQLFHLIIYSLLLSCGQFLFKFSALKIETTNLQVFFQTALNQYTIIGFLAFCLSAVMWLYILKTTPLSTAYPFMALGFLIVPIGSFFFFNESLSINYLIGVSLIVIGIYFTIIK